MCRAQGLRLSPVRSGSGCVLPLRSRDGRRVPTTASEVPGLTPARHASNVPPPGPAPAPCPLQRPLPSGNFKLEAGGSCAQREADNATQTLAWKSPVLAAGLYWKTVVFAKCRIGQQRVLIYFYPSDHLNKFISKSKFYSSFFVILMTSRARPGSPGTLRLSLGKSGPGSWCSGRRSPRGPVGRVCSPREQECRGTALLSSRTRG